MNVADPTPDASGDGLGWSLLDAVPDGVIVASTSGEIFFANTQAGTLFGGTVADLVGRSVDDLLPDDLQGRHRAHRTRYRANPTVRSMGAGLSLRARRLDGTEFHTEISLSPLHLDNDNDTYVLAAVRDITDRISAEDHLHRVLLTLDASDDGVFMFDTDTLRYTHVNEGAVRLVGYTRDELFDMTPLHINPYATEPDYRELVDRLLADPDTEIRRDAHLLRNDGIEVPVEKTYRAAPPGRDGTRWIIASARDITARLAAEEQLKEHQDALRQAEHIVVLAEDRDRIARDLHDTVIQRLFGTGLGLQSILAIADSPVRERLEHTIDDLDDTIRELRSAIFSLQGGTRSAPGGLRGQLLEVVTNAGQGTGIEPRLQFDGPIESLPPTIAQHLVPTLREALANVAKHANAHNIRVTITATTTDVTITVTDDGTGIHGETLGGRGINNLTTRAQNLGGTLQLTTPPGGGTQFRWNVPLTGTQTEPEVRERAPSTSES